jgi:hypothetical protein
MPFLILGISFTVVLFIWGVYLINSSPAVSVLGNTVLLIGFAGFAAAFFVWGAVRGHDELASQFEETCLKIDAQPEGTHLSIVHVDPDITITGCYPNHH